MDREQFDLFVMWTFGIGVCFVLLGFLLSALGPVKDKPK